MTFKVIMWKVCNDFSKAYIVHVMSKSFKNSRLIGSYMSPY